MNDSISRSSETMANCTNEILNKTKSFMNSFSYLNDLIIPGGIIIAQIMAVLMPVLISVAFLVYAERKVPLLFSCVAAQMWWVPLASFKVLLML